MVGANLSQFGSADALPVSLRLGAEQDALTRLVGGVSEAISSYKPDTTPFQVLDMNLYDGSLACSVVDGYRICFPDPGRSITISGAYSDEAYLEAARTQLSERNALGRIAALDVGSTVANVLRNKLNCVGRGDLVLYAHAAYPHYLPPFKLPRMVDRLADMVSDHGAVMTLHSYGTSDVDLIREHMLRMPSFGSPGRDCGTQKKLEEAFGMASSQLHAFSVTIPNVVMIPDNSKAVAAIFNNRQAGLIGQDAIDAAKIRNVLEVVAGSADTLNAAIADLSAEEKNHAQDFFAGRSQHSHNGDIALTVGGGHMVIGSRSLEVSRSMFAAMQDVAAGMQPPALVMPISNSVSPNFDRLGTHAEWCQILKHHHGIAHAPQVNAVSLATDRPR